MLSLVAKEAVSEPRGDLQEQLTRRYKLFPWPLFMSNLNSTRLFPQEKRPQHLYLLSIGHDAVYG